MILRNSWLAALLMGLWVAGASGQNGFGTDETATKSEAPKATEEAKGMPSLGKIPSEKEMLEIALNNMSRLRGFHVEAEITTPVGPAKLSGDLGDGTLSLKGTDPKGNQKLRIVAGGEFYLSTDSGKSWKTGDAAEKEFTILFSNLLTAPINPDLKPWEKGGFTSKDEIIDGEEVVHLIKPAQGKDAASDYWLCLEPEMAKALGDIPPVFLRKVNIIVAADDGDFPISVTYSNLTKPVDIKAPVTP